MVASNRRSEVASQRRETERARLVAAYHFGDHRRTLNEALEAWGKFIVDNVSGKTVTCS
jgi:hypothetical protein